MKNYEQMAREVLHERDVWLLKQQKRRVLLRRFVPIGASFCFAVLIGLNIWKAREELPGIPSISSETETQTTTIAETEPTKHSEKMTSESPAREEVTEITEEFLTPVMTETIPKMVQTSEAIVTVIPTTSAVTEEMTTIQTDTVIDETEFIMISETEQVITTGLIQETVQNPPVTAEQAMTTVQATQEENRMTTVMTEKNAVTAPPTSTDLITEPNAPSCTEEIPSDETITPASEVTLEDGNPTEDPPPGGAITGEISLWERKAIFEKYPVCELTSQEGNSVDGSSYGLISYRTDGFVLSSEMTDTSQENHIMMTGSDNYHFCSAVVYQITDISIETAVAVRLQEDPETYYLYYNQNLEESQKSELFAVLSGQ